MMRSIHIPTAAVASVLVACSTHAPRKEFKAMSLHEPLEVLTLAGDITLDPEDHPVVHTHVVMARSDGAPTLELYVTTYPEPLHKRLDPATDLLLIDPSIEP
jgi:predicted DNA-binding protein with PD1-like motif